jgi:hypothetical protein
VCVAGPRPAGAAAVRDRTAQRATRRPRERSVAPFPGFAWRTCDSTQEGRRVARSTGPGHPGPTPRCRPLTFATPRAPRGSGTRRGGGVGDRTAQRATRPPSPADLHGSGPRVSQSAIVLAPDAGLVRRRRRDRRAGAGDPDNDEVPAGWGGCTSLTAIYAVNDGAGGVRPGSSSLTARPRALSVRRSYARAGARPGRTSTAALRGGSRRGGDLSRIAISMVTTPAASRREVAPAPRISQRRRSPCR